MSGETGRITVIPEEGAAERRALVVIASTRAARGEADDRTGPEISAWLQQRGISSSRVIAADGPAVGEAIRRGIDDRVDVVLTSGGTGVTPDDRTPEETRGLLEKELPGIAEAIRARGALSVPSAILSRGIAGVIGETLVVNLPGSVGGVRDGLAVLGAVLDHVLDQVRGGDHDVR